MRHDPATDVLLVVDVQNDFLPGGSLAVPNGDAVISVCAALSRTFAHVVMTQDWHPPGHISFASSHPGRSPFESLTLPDGSIQILWPDHTVQGSWGSEISAALRVPYAELLIRKGYRKTLDSYSAFVEADGTTKTGLAGYLRERGLGRVFVCGLATDFCAGWSAIDAARAGFETFLIDDASRGIDTSGSMDRIRHSLGEAGVQTITSDTIEG